MVPFFSRFASRPLQIVQTSVGNFMYGSLRKEIPISPVGHYVAFVDTNIANKFQIQAGKGTGHPANVGKYPDEPNGALWVTDTLGLNKMLNFLRDPSDFRRHLKMSADTDPNQKYSSDPLTVIFVDPLAACNLRVGKSTTLGGNANCTNRGVLTSPGLETSEAVIDRVQTSSESILQFDSGIFEPSTNYFTMPLEAYKNLSEPAKKLILQR